MDFQVVVLVSLRPNWIQIRKSTNGDCIWLKKKGIKDAVIDVLIES